MIPYLNNWVYDRFVESAAVPPNFVALIHVVQRPVVLGPGQSLYDLSCVERLEKAVDWEATARHSVTITGIKAEGKA